MLREPRVSTLSGKRLIYTLDLLLPWHLCSNCAKKRSRTNAKRGDGPCKQTPCPNLHFTQPFEQMLCTISPTHIAISETQTSCSSFGESPSVLQIVIAGFKCPLMLKAGRREDKLAAAKLSGSHCLNASTASHLASTPP